MTRLLGILVCAAAALGAGALIGPAAAQAQAAPPACNVETVKREAARFTGVQTALAGTVNTSRCSSLINILRQIVRGNIKAGRQLEADQAFDPAAAQRQLSEARADPEIQAAVAAELEGVTDASRRLLLEAVVMHDKSKRLARDLLLQQLEGQVKP